MTRILQQHRLFSKHIYIYKACARSQVAYSAYFVTLLPFPRYLSRYDLAKKYVTGDEQTVIQWKLHCCQFPIASLLNVVCWPTSFIVVVNSFYPIYHAPLPGPHFFVFLCLVKNRESTLQATDAINDVIKLLRIVTVILHVSLSAIVQASGILGRGAEVTLLISAPRYAVTIIANI